MKDKIKKVLAVLLCTLMMLGNYPVFAESEQVEDVAVQKSVAEEHARSAEELTGQYKDYKVTLICNKASNIPYDASLVVSKNSKDALDIKIEHNNENIKPDSKVTLILENPNINKDTQVESEKIINSKVEEGKIEITTEEISPIIISEKPKEEHKQESKEESKQETKTEAKQEEVRTISDSDNNISVKVTYNDSAKLPEDAKLEVTEIIEANKEYSGYLAGVMEKLDSPVTKYVRILDITITDDKGKIYEPENFVDVSIELPKKQKNLSIVHLSEETEVMDATIKGKEISFSTDGFSAYAIVDAPDATSIGLERITTLEDLIECSLDGIYFGHNAGYYFTNMQYTISGTRTGIKKTALNDDPIQNGSKYYFENIDTNRFYIYTYSNNEKVYIRNTGNNSLSLSTTPTIFTISVNNGIFTINNGAWYLNMQGGANGKGFAAYNDANDANAKMFMWKYHTVTEEPYGLDGKEYGLIRYTGTLTGKALLAEEIDANSLKAVSMAVMTKKGDHNDKIYIPKGSGDISMWTFTWVSDDLYALSTEVNGATKYLAVDGNGAHLSDTQTLLKVIPKDNMICLQSGNYYLSYSGSVNTGFNSLNSKGSNVWLYLSEETEATQDYQTTYSAKKVSISDTVNVHNGSKVVIYTRVWDNTTKKYNFYAINHDGTLAKCSDSGDSIQWIGSAINTFLWDFTEYYYEGTNIPNYYYELQNEYSGKYIAPQRTNNQILSDTKIGINLNGRRYKEYYSTIVAWDDPHYSYAALSVDDGNLVPSSFVYAGDFYFAIINEFVEDEELSTVDTVDHTQYGITMKVQNYNTVYSGTNTTSLEQHNVIGDDTGGAVQTANQGLLSTNLVNGYPTSINTGQSLGNLFNNATEVNHLFLASTYNSTGYYEFDSTQNFASLQSDNNFKVYSNLGTHDSSSKPSLKHGQFLPYNDLTEGVYASKNPENLYTATLKELDDSDPRKYEKLYLINNPDYYFGAEISASFVQTPSGLDNWGHDIIYEFTGDDDFWLYVDGELIIDLGGIHSALPGSVNYSTGEVSVNGHNTTLYNLFKSNYETRNPNATTEEVNAYLDDIFTQNDKNQYIFKDYTSHEMKIFFMERGGGASNLHMKFNLSSVKPGQVILNKQISGTSKKDYRLAEYGYQILYQLTEDGPYNLLDNTDNHGRFNVTYQNTDEAVKFLSNYTPAGSSTTYNNVFFLTPTQTVAITVPDDTIRYKIIEVGVNTQVYDSVKINDEEVVGTANGANRKDYETEPARVYERQRVVFDNHVSENSTRTLTITKKLYDIEDNLIENDPTGFNFRLYLGNENATDPPAADTQDYHIKDKNGNYCIWDVTNQRFVSLNKQNFNSLTTSEKEAATFQTSPNGAISKVPAGYKIEVRDLLIGTKFKVEERTNEVPIGYKFIGYEREGTSYIVNGDAVNSGTIRDNESPAIEVKNRRGFGITANKTWSDSSYMEYHNEIYMAIYHNGNLVNGTIQRLNRNGTSLYWYFDTLQNGLSDYEVREVKLSGSYTVNQDGFVVGGDDFSVAKIDGGDNLEVTAKPKDASATSYVYTATYTKGTVGGANNNTRTDTVTNSRHGIRIIKGDMNGMPLANATFTLTDNNSNLVGDGTYISDQDGLVTIAYVDSETVYTLTETKSPLGFQGLSQPIKFKLLSNGSVSIVQGDSTYYTVAQKSGDNMASILVKNRPFVLKVTKQGDNEGSIENLTGAHFALHKEVTVNGLKIMDLNPMIGYEDLVSNNGIVPNINQSLAPNTYYIKETQAPSEYDAIWGNVKFTISDMGRVTLTPDDYVTMNTTNGVNGEVIYDIIITDEHLILIPSGFNQNLLPYIMAIIFAIVLFAYEKRLFEKRGL